MTISEILSLEESQTFDRKSIGIKAVDLSQHLCAFANADGGVIAIGISDKTRSIEGVDEAQEKVNDLLRASIDYCRPSIRVLPELVPCIDSKGNDNHVLALHIDASASLHANQQDDVYFRVGDKSKKLSFEDRLTLMYDKGLRLFENTAVAGSGWDDIDFAFMEVYLRKIGYGRDAKDYLLQNKSFAHEENGVAGLSAAAVLLFGRNPQKYFPRARIRFIRYEGNEAKTGTQMNVIKDVLFEGNILKQTQDAIAFIKTQVKELTHLGSGGVFVTEQEYPEFVLTELIVNAVTHRDYSIIGTDIQIKMFDDRIEVDSPGKLPGLVKPDNIRYTHFSRNPAIADFMKQYEYVKEYGEGVDRIFRELEADALPPLEINNDVFVLKVTAYNRNYKKPENGTKKPEIHGQKSEIETEKPKIEEIIRRLKAGLYNKQTIKNAEKVFSVIVPSQVFSSADIAKIIHRADSTATEFTNKLKKSGIIEEVTGQGKGKYKLSQRYCISEEEQR